MPAGLLYDCQQACPTRVSMNHELATAATGFFEGHSVASQLHPALGWVRERRTGAVTPAPPAQPLRRTESSTAADGRLIQPPRAFSFAARPYEVATGGGGGKRGSSCAEACSNPCSRGARGAPACGTRAIRERHARGDGGRGAARRKGLHRPLLAELTLRVRLRQGSPARRSGCTRALARAAVVGRETFIPTPVSSIAGKCSKGSVRYLGKW